MCFLWVCFLCPCSASSLRQEISDFRRFFDALAKGKETMTLDRFEDMLVCLDLAKSRKDVREYLDGVRDNLVNNEIGFADCLAGFNVLDPLKVRRVGAEIHACTHVSSS